MPPDAGRDRQQKAVRVALVEDHHLVREGLRLVLTARGIDVVGESPTAEGVFELAERTKPDIVLLDLSLAETDGITVLRELQARAPWIKVIVLTMHRDPETVRQALRAGAAGYLVKGAHSGDLEEAIVAVSRGERYLHSSIAGIVVDDSLRWLASDAVLTPREREILRAARRRCPPSRGWPTPRDQHAHRSAPHREPVVKARHSRDARIGQLRAPRRPRARTTQLRPV